MSAPEDQVSSWDILVLAPFGLFVGCDGRTGTVFCKYSDVTGAVNSSESVSFSDIKVGLDMVSLDDVAIADNLVDLRSAIVASIVDDDLTIIFGSGDDTGGAEIAVGTSRDDFEAGVCNRKFGKKAGTIGGNKLGSLGKVIGWYSKIWEWNCCASLPGRDWKPIL